MKKFLLAIMALLGITGVAKAQEPDPNFYIYLCYGQSNMEGNGQIEEIDRNNVPERFQMMAAVPFNNPKREMYGWYKATPPLAREYTGLTPVDWFGRTMIDNLPENVRIGVIVVAVGGAGIQHLDKDFDPATLVNEAGWFQNYMAAYGNKPYDRLIECAKEAQKVGVIKGMLLHQGETNNGQSDWPQRVKKVYDDILSDLDLDTKDVPLFVGETVRSEMGGACGWHNTVVDKVPDLIPNAYVISSENLEHKGDGLHFTSHSYRVLGTRYAVTALRKLGISKPVVNYSDGTVKDPEPKPAEGDYVFDFSEFNPNIWGTEGKFTTHGNIFIADQWGCGGWEFDPPIDLSGYRFLVAELRQPQTNGAQLRVWDTPNYFDKSYERDFNNQKLLVCEINGMMKNLETGIVPVNSDAIYRVGIWANGGEKIRIKHIFATNIDPYAGVTNVCIDSDDSYTVYNLQGVCLLNHADESAVKALPKGLYIVNGRKVLK